LGGGTSLPKLIITGNGEEARVLHDSSDILAFTDTLIQDENLKLYPADKREAICEWGMFKTRICSIGCHLGLV